MAYQKDVFIIFTMLMTSKLFFISQMLTCVAATSLSSWPSMTICSDKGDIDIMCAKGQKLVLASAQYGLKNSTTSCPKDGDFTAVACLRDVTAKLQNICFGHNTCNISLHSTTLKTTDPCVASGTPFLTFNYTCLPDNLLAELACGSLSMSQSDLGGLLSSADYPRTFPRHSDICVQTLQLPPEQSLTLNVIDVDMTPGKIVVACGNEIIIGVHHDNIGTCHCQPLIPSQEIHFRGNVTFRLFERSTPSRGVLFGYKVYRRLTFVERSAVVCGTPFDFPGEPENRITLHDFQNITWPNTAVVEGLPEIEPTTAKAIGHHLLVPTTRITVPPGPSARPGAVTGPAVTGRAGIKPTTRRSRPRPRPIQTTLPSRLTSAKKDSGKTVTPTFRTETNNDWHETYFGPTAESPVVHHYHYHKNTVIIAVCASVAASFLVVVLVLGIFVLCRRKKAEPEPTEMTTRNEGIMPDPLDCSFGNSDMEGLDNPTYGILP